MGDAKVPAWFAATGLQADNARVYEAFQGFLRNLPVSFTRLASEVGVSQPAVSRWAADVTRPSLEEMSASVLVVQAKLEEVGQQTERLSQVLRLIEEAMRLYERETRGRGEVDPHQRRITERLRAELGVGSR